MHLSKEAVADLVVVLTYAREQWAGSVDKRTPRPMTPEEFARLSISIAVLSVLFGLPEL